MGCECYCHLQSHGEENCDHDDDNDVSMEILHSFWLWQDIGGNAHKWRPTTPLAELRYEYEFLNDSLRHRGGKGVRVLLLHHEFFVCTGYSQWGLKLLNVMRQIWYWGLEKRKRGKSMLQGREQKLVLKWRNWKILSINRLRDCNQTWYQDQLRGCVRNLWILVLRVLFRHKNEN